MKALRKLLRLVTIASLTTVIFLLGCQSKMIYLPRAYQEDDLANLRGAGGEELTFTTSQGVQTAFYIPPAGTGLVQPETIWILFGGNGTVALDWLHYTRNWDSKNAYCLIDYPGYGKCAGSANPKRIVENINAAGEALAKKLNVKDLAALRPRLRVMGHSLGAAAALLAADHLELKRVILISPFTSLTDMANKVLFWPLGHLNLHRYDNRSLVTKRSASGAKISIFHGKDDELIPPSMSEELAKIDPAKIDLHLVDRAEHNDIIYIASEELRTAMGQ